MDETRSIGEQMLSCARTLTRADESEEALLKIICTAQELILERALRADVTKEECESAFVCAGAFLAATPLGAADEHCWRYLGPADVEIDMGDRVVCREKRYVVRDAAAVFAGVTAIYRWAVLKEEAETA